MKIFSVKSVLFSILGGAVGATLGDFFHVLFKVDYYSPDHAPFLPLLPEDVPIWVPALMGSASFGLFHAHRFLAAKLAAYTPRLASNAPISLIAPLFFVIQYLASAMLPLQTGGAKDMAMIAASFLFWFAVDRTAIGALAGVAAGIGGTAFEIWFVHAGGFEYLPDHSNLFGVPSWLICLYFSASVGVSLCARRL